ncbi:hypothetical protein L6R53_30145 [Myxococcota bacterium]|nr:hypothetical protein [Myxococcota bacterium]
MAVESELNLPRLVQALEEVARWREDQESLARARRAEIEAERERLLADVRELERQIQTLSDLADHVDQELAELPGRETRKTRQAVDVGIDAEAEVVMRRDAILSAATKRRDDRVAELLGQPDVARLLEEFEQFQEAESTLNLLPEGYRKAILAHHETVKARLQPVVDAAQATLPPHEGARESVTVVASVNPDHGAPPEVLAVLLPVPFAVHEAWTERPEDLASLLAYRVVGALGATLRAVGAPDAPMQFVDYRGHLAIQVWLGDEQVDGDLREEFGAQVDRMREQASELAAVGLDLYTAWLDPAVVTAGEDEDAEGDDDDEVEPDGPTAVSADDGATLEGATTDDDTHPVEA